MMKNDNYVMILLFMTGKSESIYCECHQYHKANILYPSHCLIPATLMKYGQ